MTFAVALHAGVLSVALSAGTAIGSAQAADGVPGFAQVRADWRSSEAVLLDRHGEPLDALRIDTTVRRLRWTPIVEVSPALRAALIRSEDRRFFEHDGVDWGALAGAAARAAIEGRTRGASTLTMQLAGLIDADLRHRDGRRSVSQKVGQAWLALRIERDWNKGQILEAYLNLAPFRGELVGIDALSRLLFGKRPDGLDARESAIAVALLRSPNAPPATVARRACAVLRAGGAARPAESSACDGLRVDVERALSMPTAGRADPGGRLAPHVARRLLTQPGSRVRSTLDVRLQRRARDALDRQLAALAASGAADGAVVVLDNASGEVLAWIGSSGARSAAPEIDHALAPRQAGSTLKPFVYALALETRRLTAASILDDSPLALPAGAGLYVPQNYDRGFRGPVTVRTALASSLNVPAVRALELVGADALFERLRALGFDTLEQSGQWYGPSLALGSADVTLAALANAYRALANAGVHTPMRFTLDAPRGAARRAFEPAASFVVADMLADRNARAATFGLDSVLATRGWAAVKTGTSKDMRDNWCVGFSGRHTVAVWIGDTTGASMRDVSGASGAAPIWAELMRALQQNESVAPTAPVGLSRMAVRFPDGPDPPRDEWFLDGTALPEVHAVEAGSTPATIAAPVSGAIVALDPDMPPDRQRLRLQAVGSGSARGVWRLDGRLLGRGAQLGWLPMPGVHRIELSIDERIVDAVRIEVRGAQWR